MSEKMQTSNHLENEINDGGQIKAKWYYSYPALIGTLIFCFPISLVLSIIRCIKIKNQSRGYRMRSIIAVFINAVWMIFVISALMLGGFSGDAETGIQIASTETTTVQQTVNQDDVSNFSLSEDLNETIDSGTEASTTIENAQLVTEEITYGIEIDVADNEGDGWDGGEDIDTFGYPIMYYEGYWDDIKLLNAAAKAEDIADYVDYDYYTIPGYDGLIFFLSDDVFYEESEGIPYGVFQVNNSGMIGEVFKGTIELRQSDYDNAEFYRDDIITEQGGDYGFDKMGWIDEYTYNHAVKRLEENKKQMEYEISQEESKQAALDNGYVPGGYSYEDIARYIDDYIGFNVSWKRGVVTSVAGDTVRVCAVYDNFYGTVLPNYDKSFVLDCSQAVFENGRPLVDDYINFDGMITGMNRYTNYIEIKANSVHVSSY
ncbi:MAG: hypothetical protein ACLRTG_10590 [Enterocloster aldenensis]